MTRLSEILDQMTTVLNDLKTVMDAEQQQLSAGHIHGSQLQRITEEKVLCWQPRLPRSSSDVLSTTRRAALMMILPNAGRRLPLKRSIYAISTSIMVGCWKDKSSAINRRSRCLNRIRNPRCMALTAKHLQPIAAERSSQFDEWLTARSFQACVFCRPDKVIPSSGSMFIMPFGAQTLSL